MTTSQPDDLNAAYAEIRRDPYSFTFGPRDWTLCHFAELDYETQAKIENSSEMGLAELAEIFEQAMGAEQFAEWRKVRRPIGLLEILFKRWVEHSGAKQGEDSASSGSSKSTGGRSKRTSAASTGSASRSRSTAKKATAKRAPRKAASQPAKSSA